MLRHHSTLREGVIAGVIGATSVAVWFLAVDILIHNPLYTPRVLGEALWSVFGPVREGTAVFVIVYTVFHYVAFCIVGITSLRHGHHLLHVRRCRKVPSFRGSRTFVPLMRCAR